MAEQQPQPSSQPEERATQRLASDSTLETGLKDKEIENNGTGELYRPVSRIQSLVRPYSNKSLSPESDAHKDDFEADIHKGGPAMSLFREILFIFVVIMAQFLTQAALNQAIVPLQIIGATFNTEAPGQLSWMPAAYSLTVGTFILPAGRIGDMYGHKKLFLGGWIWFCVWNIVAGLSNYSHNLIFYDFCRAMEGIGPAVLLPASLALLGQNYSNGLRKVIVFCIFGMSAPNGAVVGGVFAALLAQDGIWPFAYYILGITCALLGVLAFFVVPDDKHVEKEGENSFDWLGAATGVTGLILFNIAWNQAPNAGWNSPYIIVFLIVGLGLIIAFCYIETKVSAPLLPIASLNKTVALVLGCEALGWASFGIWVYYYFQFQSIINGISPILTVAEFSPACLAGVAAGIVVIIMLPRLGPGAVMAGAMLAFMTGNILLATLAPHQLYWKQLFWAPVITPFGMDMSFPAGTIILSNFVPKDKQGIAASLVTTVVNYSISIGLGMAGTLELHVNDGGMDILKGYRGAWYLGIGLDGLGLVIALYFIYIGFREKAEKAKASHQRDEEERDTGTGKDKELEA